MFIYLLLPILPAFLVMGYFWFRNRAYFKEWQSACYFFVGLLIPAYLILFTAALSFLGGVAVALLTFAGFALIYALLITKLIKSYNERLG